MFAGGLSSFLMSGARAASHFGRAEQAETKIANRLSSSGADVRSNSTTAIIARKNQSQMVGWKNSERLNTGSLSKLDLALEAQQAVRDTMIEQRALMLQASDASLSQSDRYNFGQQINNLNSVISVQRLAYENSGPTVMISTPNDGDFEANVNQLITQDFGSQDQRYLDYTTIMYANQTFNLTSLASDYANAASVYESRINMSLYGVNDGASDPDLIPYGFNRYYQAPSVISHYTAIEVSRDFAAKMQDTLEEATGKLINLDYEAESKRLAQVQAEKQLAMSAMRIAYQNAQVQAQALTDVSVNVQRLVRFYA